MPTLIPKNKKWILLGTFNLLYSLALVSLAYISKLLLDYAADGNKDKVIFSGLIFLGIVVLAVLFKVIENIIYVRVSLKREIELKRNLFENKLTKAYLKDNTHSALLMQTYTKDIDNIVTGETSTLPRIFFEAGRLAFAVILVAIIEWRFLVILIIVGLIGLLAARFYSLRMKSYNKRVLDQEGRLNSFVQESSENVKLIKSYGAKNNFMSYYKMRENDYANNKRSMYNFQVWAGNILVLGSNIIYAICIFYGGYNIALGLMTYGTLIAIMQLMNHIQSPILAISGIINSLTLYKTSFERLEGKMSLDINNDLEINDFDRIKIENISFGYSNTLFSNLSFDIEKSDIIQIKGESGIGKTSLFMLLLGFLKPQAGKITILKDNLEYPLYEANGLFSYVSQDNILFSGSIRDNFKLLVGSDALINESLRFANIYDEINSLPNGIDTILNERGSGLSIGQLQRVMIAIAYAKDRKIFLLDEFTSALDERNAEVIINNLKKENKTVIFISHKTESIVPTKVIDLTNYIEM